MSEIGRTEAARALGVLMRYLASATADLPRLRASGLIVRPNGEGFDIEDPDEGEVIGRALSGAQVMDVLIDGGTKG